MTLEQSLDHDESRMGLGVLLGCEVVLLSSSLHTFQNQTFCKNTVDWMSSLQVGLSIDCNLHQHWLLVKFRSDDSGLLAMQGFVKVEWEKWEFLMPSVPLFGFLISKDQIQMDPSKVSTVTLWPTPTFSIVV